MTNLTPLLIFSILGASLMGSVHCAGMCGGMVGFATGSLNRKRRLAGHVNYHLGRLAAYSCLGATAGMFGLGLDTAGARAGLGGSAALLAGSLMIVWALTKLLSSHWRLSVGSWVPRSLGCGFSRAFTWLTHLPAPMRAAALGLATGLLPCGWLYAFVLAAVGTGSVFAGAVVLFAFWLGTLPALIGVGSVVQVLGERARHLIPTLSACCLLALGLGSVWTRYEAGERILPWAPVAWEREANTGSASSTLAPNTDKALPPCHRH
jgi:uncharacterized protein